MSGSSEISSAIQSGDVFGALELGKTAVRSNPTDSRSRIALFELFGLTFDWERAASQLQVLKRIGEDSFVEIFERVLSAESQRRQVHEGDELAGPPPGIEPPSWFEGFVRAFQASLLGETETYNRLRIESLSEIQPTGGTIDGDEFAKIGDGDERFGPCLECFWGSHYCWMPFQLMVSLHMERPASLRDLIWRPCEIETAGGVRERIFVPVRYFPGEPKELRPEVMLARATEWDNSGQGDWQIGSGQKLICTENEEYPILGIESVEIRMPE